MTVRATMSPPEPDRPGVPWSVRWDPILGRSVGVLIAVLALAVAALVAGIAWGRSGREESPGFPVQYAPPEGLGPVQTTYMATESHGPAPLVATILYLADRGFVSLENPAVDSWRIIGRAQDAQWGVLDPGAQAVGDALGIRSPGASFAADGSIGAGKTLGEAQKALPAAVDRWASSAGLVHVAPNEYLGRVAWVVAVLLAALGFTGLGWPTMWGLPFAAFAIGGVTLLATGVGRRRTAAGRVVWSQAGGFQRLLSTPSAEDRFDFAARTDLFIAYVPYAVAFGVADRWAEKYRVEHPVRAADPGVVPLLRWVAVRQLLLRLPVRLVRLRGVGVDLGVHRLAVLVLQLGAGAAGSVAGAAVGVAARGDPVHDR